MSHRTASHLEKENSMRKTSAFLSLLLAATFASAASAECTCVKAKADAGWCGDCKMGYVDGVRVKSQKLYEAVGPSPNEGEKIDCDGCKKAMASGGVCEKCKVGYLGKNHYHSVVGYRLAKGEAKDTAKITCDGCKKNADGSGWCDKCKVGMVGNRMFKEKADFDAAAKARTTLVAATETKCDGCAVAIVSDGKCDACKAEYKDGKKVAAKDDKKPAIINP
jgi:hypothetical protein